MNLYHFKNFPEKKKYDHRRTQRNTTIAESKEKYGQKKDTQLEKR